MTSLTSYIRIGTTCAAFNEQVPGTVTDLYFVKSDGTTVLKNDKSSLTASGFPALAAGAANSNIASLTDFKFDMRYVTSIIPSGMTSATVHKIWRLIVPSGDSTVVFDGTSAGRMTISGPDTLQTITTAGSVPAAGVTINHVGTQAGTGTSYLLTTSGNSALISAISNTLALPTSSAVYLKKQGSGTPGTWLTYDSQTSSYTVVDFSTQKDFLPNALSTFNFVKGKTLKYDRGDTPYVSIEIKRSGVTPPATGAYLSGASITLDPTGTFKRILLRSTTFSGAPAPTFPLTINYAYYGSGLSGSGTFTLNNNVDAMTPAVTIASDSGITSSTRLNVILRFNNYETVFTNVDTSPTRPVTTTGDPGIIPNSSVQSNGNVTILPDTASFDTTKIGTSAVTFEYTTVQPAGGAGDINLQNAQVTLLKTATGSSVWQSRYLYWEQPSGGPKMGPPLTPTGSGTVSNFSLKTFFDPIITDTNRKTGFQFYWLDMTPSTDVTQEWYRWCVILDPAQNIGFPNNSANVYVTSAATPALAVNSSSAIPNYPYEGWILTDNGTPKTDSDGQSLYYLVYVRQNAAGTLAPVGFMNVNFTNGVVNFNASTTFPSDATSNQIWKCYKCTPASDGMCPVTQASGSTPVTVVATSVAILNSYDASQGVTSTAANSTISAWAGLTSPSSNNFALINPSGTAGGPALTNLSGTGRSSMKAIRFSDTAGGSVPGYLKAPTAATLTQFSLFMVLEITAQPTGSKDFSTIFASNLWNTSTSGCFHINVPKAGSITGLSANQIVLAFNKLTNNYNYIPGTTTTAAATNSSTATPSASPSFTPGTPFLLSVFGNIAPVPGGGAGAGGGGGASQRNITIQSFLNGSTTAHHDISIQDAITQFTFGEINVGSWAGAPTVRNLNGMISEIMFYGDLKTGGDRTNIETYLKTKYNIA